MTHPQIFTTGDGCRLAFRLDGPDDAPMLVLANSIATNHGMWDGQVEVLAKRFRVLRYDARGHGSSDAPVGAYSLDRFGRDVLELLDHLGVERTHFCGLSLGGFVGQWLGIHAPDRIDRLVLSNTASYLGPAPQWDELIRRVRDAGDTSGLAEMFIGNWFPQDMIVGQPDVVEAFRRMVLSTPARGLAGSFALVRDADLRRTVCLVEAPTLVIGGERDTVTHVAHSEMLASSIEGARLTVLPGVHMLNVEFTADFLRAVMGFLSEAPAG